MNHYSYDLVQSRMSDYRREAARMSREAEAHRASGLSALKTASTSGWSVVRKAPRLVTAVFASFA
jgi:hypothetical protein